MMLAKKVSNNGNNRDIFKIKCEEANDCDILELVKVVATRWNSHGKCMERLFTLQPAVAALCSDRSLPAFGRYQMSSVEWDIIEQMQPILRVRVYNLSSLMSTNMNFIFQTFISATEAIQTAEASLVYHIIPMIDKFNEILTTMIVNTELHLALRHAAKMASMMLDKYYTLTDESEVYRTAMGK
jgi:hypothetical protein